MKMERELTVLRDWMGLRMTEAECQISRMLRGMEQGGQESGMTGRKEILRWGWQSTVQREGEIRREGERMTGSRGEDTG